MRCDEGYLCEVCGEEVAEIAVSDLYLRYVIGEVQEAELPHLPERHIRCNPVIAQFIVDERFPPVEVTGVFAKAMMDAEDVKRKEELYTRAWQRLQEVVSLHIPISDYPLRTD